jgi:hypothetical protein
MPDPLTSGPAGPPTVALAPAVSAPPPPGAAAPPAGTAKTPQSAASLAGDALRKGSVSSGHVPQPAPLFPDGPPKPDRPWAIRSLNVRYAPERVLYGKSTIHFQQPAYGTDLTIKGVAAEDRTSFEYLYTMPNGWPQLDEPQTTMGVAAGFANGYGVEANLKHNKYIVRNLSQQVQFDGTLAGQEIHGVRPLSDYVGQYEISGGLNQVSLLGTKTMNLPAFSPKDRFSLIVKAGPGAVITWTNSWLKNDKGEMAEGPRQYHLGGCSAVGETELRYEVRKRVAVSLSNSFSYVHVASSQIAGGGKATQNILASQVALGLGYTFNFKEKAKPPTDVSP